MTTHLNPDLRRTAHSYAGRLKDVKESYVGRDDAVDVVALAALCREHVLLIGPPGTAKTALLESFCRLLGARHFSYLLTRFTEPAELFGAIDVRRFQSEGVYRVNTEGMLPTADIAFLDEVFHGSSAILNTLLTLINERTFHNGSQRETANLVTLLGATNEVPDDPALQAFRDRFLFRCRVDYVPDDAIGDVLDVGWAAERAAIRGDAPAGSAGGFTLEDLVALQRATADVDLSTVRDDLAKILLAFREEAIVLSDRRAVKAQKAIAANALLAGRGAAVIDDLAVLVHLRTTEQDETSIRRVVEAHGVSLDGMRSEVRDAAEIVYDLSQCVRRLDVVVSHEEHREVLRRLGRILTEVRAHHPERSALLADIQRAQTTAITALREKSNQEGPFDV